MAKLAQLNSPQSDSCFACRYSTSAFALAADARAVTTAASPTPAILTPLHRSPHVTRQEAQKAMAAHFVAEVSNQPLGGVSL
jgi:hypothetical protein